LAIFEICALRYFAIRYFAITYFAISPTVSRFAKSIRLFSRSPLFRDPAISRFCDSLFRDSQTFFRDPLFRERFRDSTISRFAKPISRFALSRFANFFAIGYFAIRERLGFWALTD
jgi:hypothetical protein